MKAAATGKYFVHAAGGGSHSLPKIVPQVFVPAGDERAPESFQQVEARCERVFVVDETAQCENIPAAHARRGERLPAGVVLRDDDGEWHVFPQIVARCSFLEMGVLVWLRDVLL